ncbi:MAG: T9SS type A sorting domain-containing protein [Ignavibacteria bacterium]|nr:T9SS type A sorting domain-containing protein [Ignavibacteria bacterium]
MKSNANTNYVKIDFYFYITTWDEWTGVQAGGNGLTWFTNYWSDNKVYLWNCNHTGVYNTNIFTPLLYWNRITVEKSSSGVVKVWVNGNQVVTSYNLGTCSTQDVTLALGSWENGRNIKGYIDDVTIYYTPTSVENISSELPKEFELKQNYPNPFNPITKILFSLPKSGNALLKVYDINGKEVETLVDDQLSAGIYETSFNASSYPSGVYFYKLISNDFVQTRKMIVTK